jgi:hypothetical protein
MCLSQAILAKQFGASGVFSAFDVSVPECQLENSRSTRLRTLGYGVWNSGVGVPVRGLRVGVSCLGFRIQGLTFGV